MGDESDNDFETGLRELNITKRVRRDEISADKAPELDVALMIGKPGKPKESRNIEANTKGEQSKDEGLPPKPDKGLQSPVEIGEISSNSRNIELHDDPGSSSDSDSSHEWSAVPAIASYDIYSKSGELALAAQNEPPSRGPLGGSAGASSDRINIQKRVSTFGYTKIADEEQAQRSHATNQRTDFLFNHKALNESVRSLDGAGPSTESFDEYEDAAEPGSELSPGAQLSFTKTLLSDREKLAYVGSISVLANELCTHLALTCLCTNVTGRKKLAQKLQQLQKDMGLWKSSLLSKLYEHLEISPEEVGMIENLTSHGVELKDLCKCLKVAQVVENPWEKKDIGDTNPELQESDVKNPPPTNIVHPKDLQTQSELKIDVAWTIVCDLFLLLLSDNRYDARSRTLFIKFAEVLNISQTEICEFERRIIDALDMEQSTEEQVWNETEHMKARRKKNKRRKLYYVGLATIGGSLVLGLSGGLLAPVIGAGIAAGLSTAGITGATGFLTGVGGTAFVAATSTAIGAKIGTEAMSKRMGSVRTFEFSPLHNNRRVNLIISVSGWMTGNEDDVRLPFSTVDPVEGDLYSLHWEPEMLKSTGQTINILASEIFATTVQQILGATILTAFMSAVQMPMMLSKLGYLIDNPWNVSLDRARAAGLILADTLISQNLGQRPITLMGFSLGARVIYSCLVELCKRKAAGIVENVYIFGSPIVYNREELVMVRSVVSGRFVSGYSDKDWVLCYLFRATGGGFKSVIGISEINGIEGIENLNCTELVEGHMAYRKNMPKLLKKLGISVLSEEFVDIEEAADPEQVHRQRRLEHDMDKVQKKMISKKKRNSWVPHWMKPKKAKWQEMYEESALTHESEAQDVSLDKDFGVDEDKTEKTDEAITNTSALMKELNKLKKEAAVKNEKEARTSGEVSKSQDNVTSEATDDTSGQPTAMTRSFPLLDAGMVVLPEDEVSYNKRSHGPVNFAFSDDF
ncbi:LANO_0D10286g1_1 [Lachancea nothofagi CBS 11611]|uniref:LANO_0D10286g1_1 n=1 Tax=Lachancea nothofagi CBS 11611 TaxID=1266666 RepID=A0A1G4JKT9_9SACH|nr:LANO_0D10286g1_1 [Lachancea nothofagi CBS 11611]